jgi:disulfide bond formation protein DsbB
MLLTVTNPERSAAYRTGALVLFAAAAVIATALAFERFGGYVPCPLCLQQRYAYYAGVPVLFVALVLLSAGYPRSAAVVFFLVAAAFLANAGLGAYHAGAAGLGADPYTHSPPDRATLPEGDIRLETRET